MICITIYLTVLLGKQYIAIMACVAYLSVAVIAHDGVSPYEFLFYRVVDTFLGVGIGSLVGSFHTHGKKRNDVLFVAELDLSLIHILDHRDSGTCPFRRTQPENTGFDTD